jgi:UDP:flavonoid glycosyltransferase YjiC (YdhE family)
VRVALVAGPDPGHAFPAAAVGAALRARGHDVAVMTGPQWDRPLVRDGLTPIALPLLPEPDGETFSERMWSRQAAMAPLIAEDLRAWGADSVVADTLTHCGGFAAALLGLPWAELIVHLLQDLSVALPPVGGGFTPGRGPVGKARDAALRWLTARSIAQGQADRARAVERLGVSPEAARPRVRLVATFPALEPHRPDWPADATIVGPVEWEPADAELPRPPGEGPLVVVSGTTATGVARADLLTYAIEALSGTGARVASARLGSYDGPLPPWVTVGEGKQTTLLDDARALVCNAGHGVLAKAISRGVPMVLVPIAGDQKENAARAARAGAGIVIPPHKLTAAALREATRQVLDDPSFAAAARRIAVSADGLGNGFAAETVERHLTSMSR